MSYLSQEYSGKIDLVYIDPPFNTNLDFYCSSAKTSHISHAGGAKLAYSDKFSFDGYLEFIRNRLLLIHKFLSNSGTLYFHIDSRIGHYIKVMLDGIFGMDNFLNDIARIKSNPKNFARPAYGNQKDMILVYAKKKGENIFNDARDKTPDDELSKKFPKLDEFGRRYTTVPCHAPGETINGQTGLPWRGMDPPPGRHWRCPPDELEELDRRGLIEWSKNNVPRIKKYASDHKGNKMQDVWTSYKDPQYPVYPTEKNAAMLEMIVRQSSGENSLIMDCFCGSGSFLAAGLRLGRRVIGIDESEIAINVATARPELRGVAVFKV